MFMLDLRGKCQHPECLCQGDAVVAGKCVGCGHLACNHTPIPIPVEEPRPTVERVSIAGSRKANFASSQAHGRSSPEERTRGGFLQPSPLLRPTKMAPPLLPPKVQAAAPKAIVDPVGKWRFLLFLSYSKIV